MHGGSPWDLGSCHGHQAAQRWISPEQPALGNTTHGHTWRAVTFRHSLVFSAGTQRWVQGPHLTVPIWTDPRGQPSASNGVYSTNRLLGIAALAVGCLHLVQ